VFVQSSFCFVVLLYLHIVIAVLGNVILSAVANSDKFSPHLSHFNHHSVLQLSTNPTTQVDPEASHSVSMVGVTITCLDASSGLKMVSRRKTLSRSVVL
jgi:hypothetical protein